MYINNIYIYIYIFGILVQQKIVQLDHCMTSPNIMLPTFLGRNRMWTLRTLRQISKITNQFVSAPWRIRSWESTVASDAAFQWRAKKMWEYISHWTYGWWKKSCTGFTASFTGMSTKTLVVQDFFHQQYYRMCMSGEWIKNKYMIPMGMPAASSSCLGLCSIYMGVS